MSRGSSGLLANLEPLYTVLDWGLRLAALVIILVTGYYIYGAVAHSSELFRGTTGSGVMNATDFQRHLNNMELLTKGLIFGSLLVLLCVLLRYPEYPEAGAALLVTGIVLFVGIPFLLDATGGTNPLPATLAKFGDPKGFLKGRFGLAGLLLMGGGGAHLLYHAIAMFFNARSRRPRADAEAAQTAAQVRKPNDKFMGPCWELPFCRDTEKKLCPVRANKAPCWRAGRGCYCDQNIILQLSGGMQYTPRSGSAGYLSRTASVVRPKSWSEKRDQCLACPIYLHRQSQKYKVLAPFSVIGTVVALGYFFTPLKTMFPEWIKTFGRATGSLSFGTAPGAIPAWANDVATNPTFFWLALFLAAILGMAYLLHGVEWVLYKLGM
jgi:hypothetical protein